MAVPPVPVQRPVGPGDAWTHVFTSDSLFPGGGRATNSADFGFFMDDLEERVFGPMDDATWIYPGHEKATTHRASASRGVARPRLVTVRRLTTSTAPVPPRSSSRW